MQSPGLFVGWRASPSLPGPLSDRVTISEVAFQVSDFEVVGDFGPVARTRYLLAWNASGAPAQESFPDAPAAVYSSITLDFSTTHDYAYAYQIRGTVHDQSMNELFKIEDANSLHIAFPCDRRVTAGAATTFSIAVDLRNAVNGIDFTKVDQEDGAFELKVGNELDKFRKRLASAFKVEN